MRTSKSLLLSLLILCLSVSLANGGYSSESPDFIDDSATETFDGNLVSSIHFSMDSCSAWILAGTRLDYSEFTATQELDSVCSDLSVLGGHLYRENPKANYHSCTPGFNGTPAMCISSDDACSFDAGNEKSLKIDIEISPGPSGLASLSNMSFYERAPELFVFLDGPSGLNNYATKYAVRILKGATVVYQNEDIPTNRDWTYQSIDFEQHPGLTVDQTTIFTIEMLAYCLVDNGGTNTAWDLDELTINSVCYNDPIEGGMLTTADGSTKIQICSQDGVSDAFDVVLTGNTGTGGLWLITDANDLIIGTNMFPPFDFEGTFPGTCKVWHVSHEGPVLGVEVGNSITSITGCAALSNPIVINKSSASGGILMTSSGETSLDICSASGSFITVDVIISGASGGSSVWLVTDQFGNILDIPVSVPFTLTNAISGICMLWHVSYDGVLNGLAIGNNTSQLNGCYALSNPITVNKSNIEGGILLTNSGSTDVVLCIEDGISQDIDFLISGNEGTGSVWVVTDIDLNIIDLPAGVPLTFDETGLADCIIWHISHNGTMEGLVINANLGDLSGCYALSNGVTVIKNTTTNTEISLVSGAVDTTLCLGDGKPDVIYNVNNSFVGSSSAWIITDANGIIQDIPTGPPFDFSNYNTSIVYLWFVVYEDISGLEIGESAYSLSGCYRLSNAITVNRASIEGGFLSNSHGSTEVVLCIEDGISQNVDFLISGNGGSESVWVVTDRDWNILDLPAGVPLTFDETGIAECIIWHISHDGSLEGLGINANLGDLSGCFALSNGVNVNKNTTTSSEISLVSGAVDTTLCMGDGISDVINNINSSFVGSSYAWIITDANGIIQDIPTGPPFDFSNSNMSFVYIWLVVYEDISGLEIGESAFSLSGCYSLSNPITAQMESATGGFITVDGEVYIQICEDDQQSNILEVTQINQLGSNTSWFVTDANGIIVSTYGVPSINFDILPAGIFSIYNVMYNASLSGLETGNHISELEASCYSLSNSITVVKDIAIAGTISSPLGDDIELCISGTIPTTIDINITGSESAFSSLLVLDADGNILDIVSSNSIIPNLSYAECFVRHLAYSSNFSGLAFDQNISDFTGCYEMSNAIRISKAIVDGGNLTSGGNIFLDICSLVGETTIVDFELTQAEGNNMRIVLTDESGEILEFISGQFVDLSTYPGGIYNIYNISYNGTIFNDVEGANLNDITANCLDKSNPLTILKKVIDGGEISTVSGTDIVVCESLENISLSEINVSVSNSMGTHTAIVVTDESGNIIDLPVSFPLDMTSLTINPCFIWHLSYDEGLAGKEIGSNISDLQGCYDLSNYIKISKVEVDGGSIEVNGDSQVDICIGDGSSAVVNPVLYGNPMGANSTWVLTDENGIILEVSPGPLFDFSSRSSGIYFIKHLSYDSILGLDIGSNTDLLTGCYSFSNDIEVFVRKVEASIITLNDGSDQINVCMGDGQDDFVEILTISPGLGEKSILILTDSDGNIIDFPQSAEINFENRDAGICLIWQVHFNGILEGTLLGNNIDDLLGCLQVSNSITVIKEEIIGSEIAFENGSSDMNLCVGTGLIHLLNVVEIDAGNGITSWIITDENGEILEIPSSTPFDFDDTTEGICYIYQVNYHGTISGLDIGESIIFLDGCFILSNAITVVKEELAEPVISFDNGEFQKTICSSDTDEDLLTFITGNTEGDGYYIVTDDSGVILELHENDTLDFSNATAGICHIYFINANGLVSGLSVGENIIDLYGCFKISNQLILNKLEFVSESSSSNLCFNFNDCNAIVISDDNMDYSEFTADINSEASCSQFTVIGDHLYRQNPDINIHSCTPGVDSTEAICITAHSDCDFIPDSELALRFDILVEPGSFNYGGISGLSFYERAPLEYLWIDGATGLNNYPLRFGVRILKEGEEIYRNEDISTSLDYTLQEFDFSSIDAFTIYQATTFSFELLAYCPIGNNGFVEIWDLDDIKIQSNCESQLTGGVLSSVIGLNSDEVCVDDGIADDLTVNSSGTTGPNVSWVVTDTNGNILSLPTGPIFDFEGTGSGTIMLWRVSYTNGLTGLMIGENTADLAGCFEFSNPLTILKHTGPDCPNCLANGGIITLEDGAVEITLCTDDGDADDISFVLFGNVGSTSVWLITNEEGFITQIMNGPEYNFEGIGEGNYLVWHIAYEGVLQNMTVGNNLNSIIGCYDLSNPVTIHAETVAGGGCASITQPDEENVYMLAPNPVEFELSVHLLNEIEDNDITYAVFNRLGKVLKSGDINNQKTTVNVSDLSSGMYYIRVTKNRKRFVESFVKI